MASSSESTYTIIVLTTPLLHEHDAAGLGEALGNNCGRNR